MGIYLRNFNFPGPLFCRYYALIVCLQETVLECCFSLEIKPCIIVLQASWYFLVICWTMKRLSAHYVYSIVWRPSCWDFFSLRWTRTDLDLSTFLGYFICFFQVFLFSIPLLSGCESPFLCKNIFVNKRQSQSKLYLLHAWQYSFILFLYCLVGSPVLGYLAAGVILGPHSLSIIQNVHATKTIAEFGVVFLLFNIGLEVFSVLHNHGIHSSIFTFPIGSIHLFVCSNLFILTIL